MAKTPLGDLTIFLKKSHYKKNKKKDVRNARKMLCYKKVRLSCLYFYYCK